MGNIFGHHHHDNYLPLTTTPPPFFATVTECCSGDETVVDLLCVNDYIAVTKTSFSLNFNDSEIKTITILNPNNPFTSFICEFTSLSTRSIDFYNSIIIDHNVSCCMPSLKADLICS